MMDDWTVFDGVYEPREDSLLLREVLQGMDFSGETVLDVGTGSGVQAYTALEQGAVSVTAVDVNPAALENARENIERTFPDADVTYVESDLFAGVDGRFDLVVCNPPYVPGEPELGTMEEQSWQGGERGREVTDRFVEQVGQYVTGTGGVLLLQSSRNDIGETVQRLEDRGFSVSEMAAEKLSWERLVVLHATR